MTIVRGTELGRELAITLSQINGQIKEIAAEAERMEIAMTKMRDTRGNYVMAPLLAAKAQTLHAIVLVNESKKQK
jgi:hypothetical protein